MDVNVEELVEYQFDGDAGTQAPSLHNGRVCSVEVQSEKAWHRVAAYMLATGMSQKDVAERLGKTPVMVSILWRQPWFQELVKNEIARTGGDEISVLLQGAAKDCVVTLITLRDAAKAESLRVTCCKELLDRHLGKPPQHVDISDMRPKGDVQQQADDIERQLAELRAEERRILDGKN